MLVFVRHGRTEANAAGRLLGRTDVGLDEVGRAQAAALAPVVAGADRVVASPLRRAVETADALGLPITVDERWIELDYGDLEGVALRTLPAETWAAWRADPAFVPGGGESLADLGTRVRAACEDLVDEALAATIVVVTHVSPLKAATAWALGVGDEVTWRLHVDPASVTRVAVRATGTVVVSFNDLGHITSP